MQFSISATNAHSMTNTCMVFIWKALSPFVIVQFGMCILPEIIHSSFRNFFESLCNYFTLYFAYEVNKFVMMMIKRNNLMKRWKKNVWRALTLTVCSSGTRTASCQWYSWARRYYWFFTWWLWLFVSLLIVIFVISCNERKWKPI